MTKFLNLVAETEATETDALEVPRPLDAYIDAWGTWDGASVALERSVDGGDTWHALGIALTADGQAQRLDLPQGLYRLALADPGAASSISCRFEVPELPPA